MEVVRRPVLRYFGGKWRLAPWIIENLPPHRVYVEPFGGGGSVLMRKPRSKSECYNDLDSEIVNVFRVLRDPEDNTTLKELLEWTPFSREEFDLAHIPVEEPIERARRSIVRSFFGHGADSLTREYKSGFRGKNFNANRDPSKDWINYAPQLPLFCDRLKGVIIENKDAKDLMIANDHEETLFYVDPPYPFSTRADKNHGYRFEMSDADHVGLMECLISLKGMVVLSSYENDIYSTLGWEMRKINALADGAAERVEVLYLNPLASKMQKQTSFNL